MDLLTQGLLGAALPQAAARRDEIRLASGIGFASGLLADMDALIRSAEDPLLVLEFHRHFSHSIFFIPFGALIASLLLWPLLRNRLPFARLYLYSLLGYCLSGFLDACTSYGTHWLWPISDQRLAFNIISIIDPVFSGLLLAGLVFTGWKQRHVFIRCCLFLATCYLLCGLWQHYRAEQQTRLTAEQRGHTIERLLVKPTLGNLLLWRSIYEYNNHYYVDAQRVGLLSTRTYPGEQVSKITVGSLYNAYPVGSVQAQDIQRFAVFSDHWLAWSPTRPDFLGDVRYAMLPNSIEPIWGIQLDASRPESHARYEVHRDTGSTTRQHFIELLLGH